MSKRANDLLLEPDWLLPIVPAGIVHEGWSLAIAGGRIDALGPREVMRRQYPARERLSLPHHVLMPGLVNAHGHLAMTLLRGLAEDLPLETWLRERIWPIEARAVSEAFVADGTALALLEMIRSGTTMSSDMYFFPERSAAVARQARVRAQICFPIISHPNVWSSSAADGLHKGLALYDEYRGDPLVRIAFGPHSTYSVDAVDLERTLTFADELEAPIQIHLHESGHEVETARLASGQTPITSLDAMGFLMPRLQAVHVTELHDGDLNRLASRGVGVVHCPHSNLKLGTGFCAVDRLLAAGIAVGLGTDGAASNNSLDLFAELRTATLLAKALTRDATALPAHRALAMATIGGATVLGMDREIGSLEVGKSADVIAVDLSGAGAVPVHRPEIALVHGFAGSWVRDVWVAGERILANGSVLTLDEQDILHRATHWAERIGRSDAHRRELEDVG